MNDRNWDKNASRVIPGPRMCDVISAWSQHEEHKERPIKGRTMLTKVVKSDYTINQRSSLEGVKKNEGKNITSKLFS